MTRPGYARSGYEAQTRDPERRAFFDLSKRISELEDALEDAVDKLPRGIVKKGTFVTNSSPLPANTATTVTNPLTVTVVAGRRYRICVEIRAVAAASANVFHRLTLRNNGVAVNANQPLGFGPGLQYNILSFHWLMDGDGAAKSLDVTVSADGGASTFYAEPDTAYFYIEDVGRVV